MADADAHAAIVAADVCCDRTQAIVPRISPPSLNSYLRWREIYLIVKYYDVFWSIIKGSRGLADRAPRFVHVGAGQQQQHALGAERSFRRRALEAPAPGWKVVTLG